MICTAFTVAIDGDDVTVDPSGALPTATAVSVIDPWFRSVWVTVYVAVQTSEAPGASDDCGHVIADRFAAEDGALCVSMIAMFLIVTLPVFLTANEYVTCAPTVETVVGLAVFSTDSDGFWVAVIVIVEPGDVVVPPPGVFPLAVAVSMIDPLSISACVTV